jgi:hypothetical protein
MLFIYIVAFDLRGTLCFKVAFLFCSSSGQTPFWFPLDGHEFYVSATLAPLLYAALTGKLQPIPLPCQGQLPT